MAELARTSSARERAARESVDQERKAVVAEAAAVDGELRRTMDQITKIVSAGLRDSAAGSSAKQQPAKPPAVEVVKLPEGVPDMSAPFPPRFLVTTQARITRRITVVPFADDASASRAFRNSGSKLDGRLLLRVQAPPDGGELAVAEVDSWAIVLGSAKQDCLAESRRWLRGEEFRRRERSADDLGKRSKVERESPKVFGEGTWAWEHLSIRGRDLVLSAAPAPEPEPASDGAGRPKCARDGCNYLRHSTQGHEYCCNACRGDQPHGPACEREPVPPPAPAPKPASGADEADVEIVMGAPLLAWPANRCTVGLPKSLRPRRPHCFRIDVDREHMPSGATKVVLDPHTQSERDAWILAIGRAGGRIPDEFAETLYIEDEARKLPRGGLMDWLEVRERPEASADAQGPGDWRQLWFEWRYPVLSYHERPGSAPIAVLDTAGYELSQDDAGRAFSWQLRKRPDGAAPSLALAEPEPEPEMSLGPEPEPEPETEPETESDEGFVVVDAAAHRHSAASPGGAFGSQSDSVSWLGLAAGSAAKMDDWTTALGVSPAAMAATHAGNALGSAAFNALAAQWGASHRLDLAGPAFVGLSSAGIDDVCKLAPRICSELAAVFVPDSISRSHWERLRRGLPQLRHIYRGISMRAHDSLLAQASASRRLELSGPEFAQTTVAGLVDMARACAEVEEIFLVRSRETATSSFPRGPFCICNAAVGTMLVVRDDGDSIQVQHEEGQVWEYDAPNKAIMDPRTRMALELSSGEGSRVSMQPASGTPSQQWIFREADKAIINPPSGKVLDIEGGVEGTAVIAYAFHGRENQQWSLLHDDDTTTHRHAANQRSAITMSDEQMEFLKARWPKLRVAFLGREISSSAYDTLMRQYTESGRVDLTGEEFADLTGLGMYELAELCPKPTKIFLHSRHPFSSLRLKELKRELHLADENLVVRDIKLSDCVALDVMQAARVDHKVVQKLVPLRALPQQLEMQEGFLERQSSRRSCFRCDGTGLIHEARSAITISFATDLEDETTVTCSSWLFRDSNEAWKLFDRQTAARLEHGWREATSVAGGVGATVQLLGPDGSLVIEVDLQAMTQTDVRTGAVSAVLRADEALGERGHPCWICNGTGSTTKWLKEFDSQLADEEHECLICCKCSRSLYVFFRLLSKKLKRRGCTDGDASFGVSTECSHRYCEECIRGTLQAMMDTAQFPAFCPQCRMDATDDGTELSTGRILPDALSFLAQRDVISKDFLFRFLKQNAGEEEQQKYFPCPAKCGRFLIEQEVEFKTDSVHGVPVMTLGACPCGACVCLRCHREETVSAATHQCPAAEGGSDIDAASLALVAKNGKKCPKCKSFVQRTQGCHGA